MIGATASAAATAVPAAVAVNSLGGVAAKGAEATPNTALAPTAQPEHPWEKAHRLAKELSIALAEVRESDIASSLCVAVVHPAGKPYAVGFADIDSYDRGWRIARETISAVTVAGAPETDDLVGLPLAAIHIERAVQAMGDFHFGKWEVTIRSGEPEQVWSFRQLAAHDPLFDAIDAIDAYRRGNEAFNGTPDCMTPEEEAAQIAATYGPPLEVLKAWDKPARTLAGAVAALRLAADENTAFLGSDIADVMVRVALDYLAPSEVPNV
jgi:hypothetical protein